MYLFSLLLALFFVGCGVETASSSAVTDANTTTETETNTTVETNTTTETETNTTVETNTTTETETNTTVDSNTTGLFVEENATFDPKACGVFDGYLVLKDNSLDPEGVNDAKNGLQLSSSMPFLFEPKKSEVTLYYSTLQVAKEGRFVTVFGDGYIASFDTAWVNNTQKTVYVKKPTQTDRSLCFRFDVSSTQSTDIVIEKVYR